MHFQGVILLLLIDTTDYLKATAKGEVLTSKEMPTSAGSHKDKQGYQDFQV